MSDALQLYWDSSCFICLLKEDEPQRRAICEDILGEVQKGTVEIWTSEEITVEAAANEADDTTTD